MKNDKYKFGENSLLIQRKLFSLIGMISFVSLNFYYIYIYMKIKVLQRGVPITARHIDKNK